MASPSGMQRSFNLYVTHLDADGYFLKISGQLDHQSSLIVETLFEAARADLENGVGAAPPAAIREGIICAAKYKDGIYYRAKVINTSDLATGLVGVQFIDYGNKDIISLNTIRFLDKYDPLFLQIPGQATDYYISRLMHLGGRWDEPLLMKLQTLVCYAEYPATIEAQTRTLPLVAILFKGTDLSTHIAANRMGAFIPLPKQDMLLSQMTECHQGSNWSPSVLNQQTYTEHVPFLINQNFPNPATAMRLNQQMTLPCNISPQHSVISQSLLVNRASRNAVNLRAPARQPQHITAKNPQHTLTAVPPTNAVPPKPSSPKKSTTYKSRLLEVNSQHKVFVSYADEGPELFAIQMVSDANLLQNMMDEINRRPHKSLAEPPMIGTVCLGRMSGDRIICRAIVMNLSGSQCKLFFVDFGDTEMVSYYDIFDIPEEFVKPNVFAMRFCLSGVKKLEKSPHLNKTFKQLVNGNILTLRVVAPEGPPLIQYGELYLDNKNVLELLMANMKDNLQFKWMEMLSLGTRHSVLVSYVDSCIKFYVQLSEKIDELNAVMEAVKVHCEHSSSPGPLPVGAVCCARFPDDDNWYRAMVRHTQGEQVVVAYVDYGNEQEVNVSDLRTITPGLIQLPAQALKCALKGFENKPVETKTSNQLEMLALEKTLTMTIDGFLSKDTMLVSLVDDTVSPLLDIARRMNQLSQPRGSVPHEKTTQVRRDTPGSSIGSHEDSVPDDPHRSGFRREKSFRDERKSREDGFSHRGSSFRARDHMESFDTSAPGHHSDKFAKPDRRGKPWENQTPNPAPAGDDWEESPPLRQSRDNNRESRKKDGKQKGWKKESSVGRRLQQARDAANSAHASPPATPPGDIKRRDRFSHDGFNKFDTNRSDRRDNRGDRRDNWGDKKENWGDIKNESCEEKKEGWNQKREPRDNITEIGGDGNERFYRSDKNEKYNRGDRNEIFYQGDKNERFNRGDKNERFNRGDRNDGSDRRGRSDRGGRGGRSNFTRRDRPERSCGSDSDKRSERSYRTDDRGGRGSRDRYKKNPFQYKELANPVPLDSNFTEPAMELGSQHEASVTWIISPENFYTQLLSQHSKFLEMMHKIPEMYKGVKFHTGNVGVGNSVLARYPVDGVLYRAVIVSVEPFSKYIVQYIDFGNEQLVDAKDIWQLDQELMELPKMAVHCSLAGVVPVDGEWMANPDIDLCFSAPRYQCIFHECMDDRFKVSLWNNSVSVADMLVEKQLASVSEHQSPVALTDEPIDLTIIIGQQILCRVTHVESYDKFYVQLDLEKARLVERAIDEYDTAQLTPLSAERVAPGSHCVVRGADQTRRAILADVSDVAITAVLPDYGNTVTVTVDNLMVLPPELSLYYYQSLECCLHNYDEGSKPLVALDELRTQLAGNKVIMYINDVDGIRLMSTLYEPVTGKKIAIFEPDPDAYDEVTPLCPSAVFNYNFGMAYVSHVESLNEVYLLKATDSDSIAAFLDLMYQFYEEGTPEALETCEVGDFCAAKSSDGNWYRATIVSIADDEVTVQFPDYGNTERVHKDALRKLDTKFFEPCYFVIVAGLNLVACNDNAIEKLREWTTEKEVEVTLAFGNDGWLARLHLDGVDLTVKLVNENLATPKPATKESPEEAVLSQPISVPVGCTQVYISHIDTPGQFWLQMSDKVDKIEEIQAELQANFESYADIDNREMGTLCAAKYSADDQWYRAEILDADSDITTVRFIDYGNTDVLDNQPGLIKVIPDNMKEIERYAIKASVNAVPTGTGQWSEPTSDYFTQLVGDLSNPVDALIVLKDVTTYVDVYVNGQNLTDQLVSEGHATKSDKDECGDLPSCFASHVNSPSEFWLQLESATFELQAMEAAMVDAENFPPLETKEEGVLCAALYPEDGAWYRAQVIVDGSEGTEVLFMDYGNASITGELRNLPDELKIKPALSRKCALQKPRDIKWSQKSEVKFNELAAEGATIFNVQFIASGDVSIVDLFLGGKSVTEELLGLCEEHPLVRLTPVGQDTWATGKICYLNSLKEIYIHLDDSVTNIDKVTEVLAGGEEFEPVSELKVGSICAALWTEDEQWYRVRILEFGDVGAHVQFIDYGNKAKCENFRQLPEEILGFEPLAKCCRLCCVEDAMNEETKLRIDDLVAELTTFQIEFLDSITDPPLVKLLIDGVDIISVLNDKPCTEPQESCYDVDNTAEESGSIFNELEASKLNLNESICSMETFVENKTLIVDIKDACLESEMYSLALDHQISSETLLISVEEDKLDESIKLEKQLSTGKTKELNETRTIIESCINEIAKECNISADTVESKDTIKEESDVNVTRESHTKHDFVILKDHYSTLKPVESYDAGKTEKSSVHEIPKHHNDSADTENSQVINKYESHVKVNNDGENENAVEYLESEMNVLGPVRETSSETSNNFEDTVTGAADRSHISLEEENLDVSKKIEYQQGKENFVESNETGKIKESNMVTVEKLHVRVNNDVENEKITKDSVECLESEMNSLAPVSETSSETLNERIENVELNETGKIKESNSVTVGTFKVTTYNNGENETKIKDAVECLESEMNAFAQVSKPSDNFDDTVTRASDEVDEENLDHAIKLENQQGKDNTVESYETVKIKDSNTLTVETSDARAYNNSENEKKIKDAVECLESEMNSFTPVSNPSDNLDDTIPRAADRRYISVVEENLDDSIKLEYQQGKENIVETNETGKIKESNIVNNDVENEKITRDSLECLESEIYSLGPVSETSSETLNNFDDTGTCAADKKQISLQEEKLDDSIK
ncbi:tudor domain-containing 6-like isoform X3 [Leptidea sinapis]|uniref:tudor domain-containing 6-like isoform X3 n=1 Tax=Leptidea sinapis TaxID=189913 RepID=UPI0021C309B6|nr:tudor domain-containing 6-like isoform X3 [Leptidea sinapis]